MGFYEEDLEKALSLAIDIYLLKTVIYLKGMSMKEV